MYKEYVRHRMKALREHKKREDPDAYREITKKNSQKYRENMRMNQPEKYKEYKEEGRVRYWRNLKDKIAPDDFLKRFVNLERRNPEQAQLVKEKLRL